jgi:folate-binding protein YgfZ
MQDEWNRVPLEFLGVLSARGADAVAYLQGQLSNDVMRLSGERSVLAGYHNPQGRVIALLRLMPGERDEVLAVLPRELIGVVASRLGKFILRAKVTLTDASGQWHIAGLIPPEPGAGAAGPAPPLAPLLPAAPDRIGRLEGSMAVRVGAGAPRWLLLSGTDRAPQLERCKAAPVQRWYRHAVAAGEPQVYAATSEQFVAQMLNLDLLDAVAFEKGCYTGQEVIARAHYRGRVKRRLQRFRTAEARALRPGDAGELTDGRAFRVVESAPLGEGGCEFLAVAPLPGAAGSDLVPGKDRSSGAPLPAESLELPYALPG